MRIIGVFLALFSATAFHQVLAQPYPARPIRLIVGNQGGSGMDVAARIVANRLSEKLGAQLVVDNRPGGAMIIAHDLLARAAPDGYTLLLAHNALAILPLLHEKLPYDTRRDFAPITLIATSANILVAYPKLAADSVSDIVALAKSKPGQLTLGVLPPGSFTDLCGKLFETMAGVRFSGIQYRGGPAAVTDLVAGRIMLTFTGVPVVHSHIKERRLKGLAVTTITRSSLVPDIPTFHESGVPGYDAPLWYGLLAPAGTPASVLKKVQAEAANTLNLPEVRNQLLGQGLEAAASSPEALGARIEAERRKWEKVLAAKR